MRVITRELAEALGRLTTDSAMLALFVDQPEKAMAELGVQLSADDTADLQMYVEMLRSGSDEVKHMLASVLRSADRMVQN